MGRTISSDLATILAAPTRQMDWTIKITLPDSSVFRFATSPLTISSEVYTNDIESIKEIRQSIGGPIDRVGVALQNKDGVLGLAVAADPDLWRRASAIVGRYYQNAGGTLAAWKRMFSGDLQQPEITDLQVTTDIVSDVASAGLIVCNRTCATNCPFKFKHSGTCGYAGGLTTCSHLLKSPDGCDGRSNSHHFGGTEHRYPTTLNEPGTGGNGGIDPPPYCPRVDQWIRVQDDAGRMAPKQAFRLTEVDMIWDPIAREFFKARTVRVVKNVEIWRLATVNGCYGYSSHSHRIMPDSDHPTGLAVRGMAENDKVLTEIFDAISFREPSFVVSSKPSQKLGDVVFIEMTDGHHYAYGDHPEKMIVAHNSKPLEDIP